MNLSERSLQLTDLSWTDVDQHLHHDRRLLVPVGVCDQYGPHLPIGSGTVVAEAVAAALSRELKILLAPTIPLGVNLPSAGIFAGAATIREKTLHGLLNDALGSWEDHGFEEFILLTAHNHDPHVDALASVTGTRARVRVIELLGIDFSAYLQGPAGPQHGGEVLTSLMLYLQPDKVNRDRIEDFPIPRGADVVRGIASLPKGSLGAVGAAHLATEETGARIFEHILTKIRDRVLVAPIDDP